MVVNGRGCPCVLLLPKPEGRDFVSAARCRVAVGLSLRPPELGLDVRLGENAACTHCDVGAALGACEVASIVCGLKY